MNKRMQPKISIWRPMVEAIGVNGIAKPGERLPVTSLTAGQGKIRLAG
jgi:hypothetical protein